MQKIILTGPESTGKTTIAKKLANHFGVEWIPEYAREYLEKINRPYQQADLVEIAKNQMAVEDKAMSQLSKNKTPFFICDTSFLVLKIWSEFKYGNCHSFIIEQLKKQTNALFILCGTDVKWEFDPLRENPEERELLYQMYKNELLKLNMNFFEINGTTDERIQKISKTINTLRKL